MGGGLADQTRRVMQRPVMKMLRQANKLLTKQVLTMIAIVVTTMARADDLKPEYETWIRPMYPLALLKSGISGKVRLEFNVHHDSSVTDIVPTESYYREFTNSAVYAASRWRFKSWEVTATRPEVIRVSIDLMFNRRR